MSNVEPLHPRRAPNSRTAKAVQLTLMDHGSKIAALDDRVTAVEGFTKDFKIVGDRIIGWVKTVGVAVVSALLASGFVNPQTGKFLGAFFAALN